MILYFAKGEKINEPITIKIMQPKDENWVKKIFEKANKYLEKIKLKILNDLKIIKYKNGGGHILFKFQKNNIELTSNQLSSGEWQYVITIIFLVIKNENLNENKKKSKIYDPIIFVDQPEDNFDPLLQERVIDAYIDIFPKNAQFFISTHSPFIIRNLINTQNDNCLLYNFNDYKAIPIVSQDGNSQYCDTLIFYKNNGNIMVSQHEINYLIFRISSFEYFLELYYTIIDKNKTKENDSETKIMKDFLKTFFNSNGEKYKDINYKDIWKFRNSRCHINFKENYNLNTLQKYITILREAFFWYLKQQCK